MMRIRQWATNGHFVKWLGLSLLSLGALSWGHTVQAKALPTLTIGGDVTEIAVALGAESQLVGRDDTSLAPPRIQSLPSVGYLRRLSAESLMTLHPQRLIVSHKASPREVVEQVAATGVEVHWIEASDRVSDLPEKVRQVGAALGRSQAAQQLNRELTPALHEVEDVPDLSHVKAMLILSHAGMAPMVAGSGTSADLMMQSLGVSNAFHDMQGYQRIGADGLLQAQPNLVLVSEAGLKSLGGEAGLWRIPGLSLTPAGQTAQVLVLDETALLTSGPRTPKALLALRQAIQTSFDRLLQPVDEAPASAVP